MRMRGTDVQQGGLFSYVSLEERIPADHPLRGVRKEVQTVFFSGDGSARLDRCRDRVAHELEADSRL